MIQIPSYKDDSGAPESRFDQVAGDLIAKAVQLGVSAAAVVAVDRIVIFKGIRRRLLQGSLFMGWYWSGDSSTPGFTGAVREAMALVTGWWMPLLTIVSGLEIVSTWIIANPFRKFGLSLFSSR